MKDLTTRRRDQFAAEAERAAEVADRHDVNEPAYREHVIARPMTAEAVEDLFDPEAKRLRLQLAHCRAQRDALSQAILDHSKREGDPTRNATLYVVCAGIIASGAAI